MGGASAQIIRDLVSGLRETSIKISVPRFDDSSNPNVFLEKLEKYFKLKRISNADTLDILDGVFEGRARIWFDTQNFDTFDAFKIKFLEEFFSIPVRVKIKSAWLARRFNSSKDHLNNYFLNQVSPCELES